MRSGRPAPEPQRWTTPPLSTEALIPEARWLIDRYEFMRELGRGGIAVVYLARERGSGRLVALKLLGSRHAGDPNVMRRFAREARTVARLDHPNIVRTLAIEEHDGSAVAIVSVFVPNQTLRVLLREWGKLSFDRATQILRDVASALAYAHRERIVHRDVKPENIFIDSQATRALLSDFGIARQLDGDTMLTAAGSSLGTPTYMSPEQITGAPVDERTDVYALGLVGWEMLAGRRPWEGETLYGVLHKQQHEQLTPLAELRPGIPEFLRVAIEGALKKDPRERWRDGEEFFERLTSEPFMSPAPSPKPVVHREIVVPAADVPAVVAPALVAPEVVAREVVPPAVAEPEPIERERIVPEPVVSEPVALEPVAPEPVVPDSILAEEASPQLASPAADPVPNAEEAILPEETTAAPSWRDAPRAELVAPAPPFDDVEPIPGGASPERSAIGSAPSEPIVTPPVDVVPSSTAPEPTLAPQRPDRPHLVPPPVRAVAAPVPASPRPGRRGRGWTGAAVGAAVVALFVVLAFSMRGRSTRTTEPGLDSLLDAVSARSGGVYIGDSAATTPARPRSGATLPAARRSSSPAGGAGARTSVSAPGRPAEPAPPTNHVIPSSGSCTSATAAGQRACLLSAIARNDGALTRTYVALVGRLRRQAGGVREPPAVRALRAEQRAWVDERDRGCRAQVGTNPGAGWAAALAPCFARQSRDRAVVLEARLRAAR